LIANSSLEKQALKQVRTGLTPVICYRAQFLLIHILRCSRVSCFLCFYGNKECSLLYFACLLARFFFFQGFEMYIKKLRENAPVMPASASVESYSGSDASSTSSSAAAGGDGGGGGGSRGGSRGGGGGGRSSDVASNSSTTALPMIGDEEDGEDDGGEDAPLLD